MKGRFCLNYCSYFSPNASFNKTYLLESSGCEVFKICLSEQACKILFFLTFLIPRIHQQTQVQRFVLDRGLGTVQGLSHEINEFH